MVKFLPWQREESPVLSREIINYFRNITVATVWRTEYRQSNVEAVSQVKKIISACVVILFPLLIDNIMNLCYCLDQCEFIPNRENHTKGNLRYNSEEDEPSLCSHSDQDNQFSSVAQSCPTLCGPMNRSTPGLPVHHHLPEFTQTHSDSCPLSQ